MVAKICHIKNIFLLLKFLENLKDNNNLTCTCSYQKKTVDTFKINEILKIQCYTYRKQLKSRTKSIKFIKKYFVNKADFVIEPTTPDCLPP
jgi:hypothetical protein